MSSVRYRQFHAFEAGQAVPTFLDQLPVDEPQSTDWTSDWTSVSKNGQSALFYGRFVGRRSWMVLAVGSKSDLYKSLQSVQKA